MADNFKVKKSCINFSKKKSVQNNILPLSFLQTTATMEMLGLIATSILILTQP